MRAAIDDDAALATFVGKHQAWYRRKWAIAAAHGGVSWNWAACLFGPFWMAYRRMYWQVGVYAMWMAVVPVAEAMMNHAAPVALARSLAITPAIVLGMFGNQLYKSHADATIHRLREHHWSPETVTDSLARSGGTSWLGVVVMATLLLMVFVSLRPLTRLA
jgi:hypothetical protein